MKKLIVLGSTGSIGKSSLEVIYSNPDYFQVAGLAANKSIETLLEQISLFRPKAVAVTDMDAAEKVSRQAGKLTQVYRGLEGLLKMIGDLDADAAINGLVGSVGMVPTLKALQTGKEVLLANKETMVMGGEIIMETAKKTGKNIIPIDSEMSAIYQCLKGEKKNNIKRLILTASGGPFVDLPASDMESVTVEQALNHPTWGMGTKNTIDSATLVNKGLEVIEASRMFEIPGRPN